MTAVTLDSLATPPALREDLEAPTPAGDEVLVRVQASSANPVDNSIAAGMLKDMVEHEFPVTLGRDYAGASSRSAPRSPATPSATRSSASCCTPTRPSTTAAGPSSSPSPKRSRSPAGQPAWTSRASAPRRLRRSPQ